MVNLDSEDRQKLISILQKSPVLRHRQGIEAVLVNAGLQKLLPMIDLDGIPFVVVTNLIHQLETYGRLTYENEALGCFLNFLKEAGGIIGEGEQDFLSHILTEYKLMEPIAKSSGMSTWRGKSNVDDIKEEIIGEDTLRPIAFLQKGLEVAEAVVRVKSPSGLGTGFMITPDLLLTCHHVLHDPAKLSTTRFQFNYQEDFEGNAQEVREFKAKEGGVFYGNEDLDYTVVEIDGSPGHDSKYLPLRPCKILKKERVNIIQHPAGMPKKISLQNSNSRSKNSSVLL